MAQSLLERFFKGSAFDTPDAAEQYDIIEFFKGNTTYGSPFYAYLAVPAGEFSAYREAVATGKPFDLSDYGEILASGTGHVPEPAVIAAMKEDYGINHEFEAELLHAAEEMQQRDGGRK